MTSSQLSKSSCEGCYAGLDRVPLRECGDGGQDYAAGTWRYRGKRERVRIARCWTGYIDEHVAVRCHPCHGGKPWVAPLCEFLKRFDLVEPETAAFSTTRSTDDERIAGLGTCSKCDDHNYPCVCRMACTCPEGHRMSRKESSDGA